MNDFIDKEKLHFAAQDGDLEEVKQLISKGYDINMFDDLGKTPLHYAVENNHINVVKYLINSGADVNAHLESVIGNTPLAEVSSFCSYEVAEILIAAGANPTIQGWMQLTALDRARSRKKEEGEKVYALLKEAAKKF